MTQGFYIEHNGDTWQSVFPEHLSALSALHTTIEDAYAYMVEEGVDPERIRIVKPEQTRA